MFIVFIIICIPSGCRGGQTMASGGREPRACVSLLLVLCLAPRCWTSSLLMQWAQIRTRAGGELVTLGPAALLAAYGALRLSPPWRLALLEQVAACALIVPRCSFLPA
ncbi:hypothetical protein C8J57DRAFT_1321582, partial [Mycena rebaudengoi]